MRKLFLCLTLLLLLSLAVSGQALAQGNLADGLLDSFVNQTDGWWGILRGYALFLFTLTLTIEVAYFGIRAALGRADIAETIGQFVTTLLFAGLVAAVIMNYQEWATGVAVNGLKPLIGELTGNSVDAGQPLAMAAAVIDKVVLVIKDAGITNFGEVFLYICCLLIVLVVFVLISTLVIVTTCEFYIVANIGVLLVGLGGSKIFKDYATNVMRYVLAVAIKLFVLQIIINIGFTLISLSDIDSSANIKFVELFYVIGKAIILFGLAKTLPDSCAGMLSGSVGGGGNALGGAVTGAAKMGGALALGAVTGGAGFAAGAAGAAANAHTIAKASGATGFGQTARAMVQSGFEARNSAKAAGAQRALDANPGSIRNQLRSAANAAKASGNLLGSSGASSGQANSFASSPGGSGQPAPQPANYSADFGQTMSQAEFSNDSNVITSQSASSSFSSPGGSGQPAPQPTNFSSDSGSSAPQSNASFVNSPGGSGQPAPQPTNYSSDSTSTAPQSNASVVSGPGGSGQPAPQVAIPSGQSTTQTTTTTYEYNEPPARPRGTVDMRKFNPSKKDGVDTK